MLFKPIDHTLNSLTGQLKGLSGIDALRRLTDLFPGQVVFSTSVGYEGQVITDLIATNNVPVRFFTPDTGRMYV